MSRGDMSLPKLALLGTGRMGTAVAERARDRGWNVVAELGRESGRLTRGVLRDADVVIDFTSAEAAPDLIIACATAGVPVVSGTTGWLEQKPRVDRMVLDADGALLWSPNFSLGVHVFWRVASRAARLMSRVPGVDARILETHHTAKRDAPSGTALELARRIGRESGTEPPITSIRVGAVPGTHELLLDGQFEQIRITHEARDRRVFAEGALTAAQWILDGWRSGRRGIFTMDDLLDSFPDDGTAEEIRN